MSRGKLLWSLVWLVGLVYVSGHPSCSEGTDRCWKASAGDAVSAQCIDFANRRLSSGAITLGDGSRRQLSGCACAAAVASCSATTSDFTANATGGVYTFTTRMNSEEICGVCVASR
jgi:hypothetical protein